MSRLDNLKAKVEALYAANNPNADAWSPWAYKNHILVWFSTALKVLVVFAVM